MGGGGISCGMVRARGAAKGVGANCCVQVAYSDESSERDSGSKVGGWDLRRGGVGAVVLCAFGRAFGGREGAGFVMRASGL